MRCLHEADLKAAVAKEVLNRHKVIGEHSSALLYNFGCRWPRCFFSSFALRHNCESKLNFGRLLSHLVLSIKNIESKFSKKEHFFNAH